MSYQIETQITDLIKIASIDFLILLTSFYHSKLKFEKKVKFCLTSEVTKYNLK